MLRALIVGCGRIAGGDDWADSAGTPITHAGSYVAHPGFELVACIEPDAARRAEFMKRWDVPHGFASLADFAASGVAADVVSICTPTAQHASLLRELLALPVKLVFCEKPLTADIEEGYAVAADYARARRPIAVNYTRRWNPTVIALHDEISSGAWGRLITGVGFYTKGILNNGGHLVDLLRFLFGEMEVVGVTGRRFDAAADDPTVDAVLKTDGGAPVHLVGADARAFYMFELTLVFERGAVSLENTGANLRVRRAVSMQGGGDERALGEPVVSETAWRAQFLAALDGIHATVTSGAALASSAETALAAQAICADLVARSTSAPRLGV